MNVNITFVIYLKEIKYFIGSSLDEEITLINFYKYFHKNASALN